MSRRSELAQPGPAPAEGAAGDPGADEVDRIIAGWGSVRPDLDTAPLAALSRIGRLARRLESARREAFASSGIEGWEFDVLTALRRAEEPVTAGQLMRQTLVTSGTMTTRIDKLARKGLVTRARDERDRRAVRIALTPEGVDRVDDAMQHLLAAEEEILAPLPRADRAALASLLKSLLIPFEADA